MDGYAVCSADLRDPPTALRLLEIVAAGGWPSQHVAPGTASAVMTGAPVPEGADAVVMVESTDGALEGSVRISAAATPGQHIRRRGSDISQGTPVIAAGIALGPGALGLLGALGLGHVDVARRPRVGLLTTGDEVVAPGTRLQPGQIWSANHITLAALARSAGAVPVDLGLVGDDGDAIAARLRGALDAGCDLVVTTGGVSVGAFDVVKDAFAAVGGAVDFWKVKMKPGKPLAFGTVGRVPLFGLPGNPVSCMVNFLQFVRPWIRTALGDPRPLLPVVHATALDAFAEPPGRETFVRVCVEVREGRYVAALAGGQGSHALSAMARANGFAWLPEDSAGFVVGDTLRVQLFSSVAGSASDIL